MAELRFKFSRCSWASHVALVVKNMPTNAGDTRDTGLTPWRRAWQSTLVFLPGKSHRMRSLAGYKPKCCKKVGYDLATKPLLPYIYTYIYKSIQIEFYYHFNYFLSKIFSNTGKGHSSVYVWYLKA